MLMLHGLSINEQNFNLQEPTGAAFVYTLLIVLFTYFYAFHQVILKKELKTYKNKVVIFQACVLVSQPHKPLSQSTFNKLEYGGCCLLWE